jgi:hypothetical protein
MAPSLVPDPANKAGSFFGCELYTATSALGQKQTFTVTCTLIGTRLSGSGLSAIPRPFL